MQNNFLGNQTRKGKRQSGLYHNDFPLPVAMTTRQSLLSRIFSITSFWYGRNSEYPKNFCDQTSKPIHKSIILFNKIIWFDSDLESGYHFFSAKDESFQLCVASVSEARERYKNPIAPQPFPALFPLLVAMGQSLWILYLMPKLGLNLWRVDLTFSIPFYFH